VPIAFPHILGREFAGEVAALGDASSSFCDQKFPIARQRVVTFILFFIG
jgi:NADPH:quinone reductase-like Zn-dependent oxidoreductase